MPVFDVLFPVAMIIAPAFFLGLWCLLTGVRGVLPILLATLAVLVLFGASHLLLAPAPGHALGWGLGGFWLLMLVFAMPAIRRATTALPELPRAASLKPRRVELFRGAIVWPWFAWAALSAWSLWAHGSAWLAWLGPVVGFTVLLALPRGLRAAVLEPEPLGGADPNALAKAYERFRRSRVRTLYWLFVLLALAATSNWLVLPLHPAWGGTIIGVVLGLWGALFGTWADAQRYLLRRQLSGAEPPA